MNGNTKTAKAAGVAVVALLMTTGITHAQKAPKSVLVQMETSAGQDAGKALLINESHGVKFEVEFKSLDPGTHGIHVHQVAKCDTPDFKSAGGHFNPGGKQHGMQNPQGHHAGDLPNIVVGDDGMVKTSFFSKDLTLDPSKPNSVFANGGTSLMIHSGPDDMKTDPSGNSGSRAACGLITMDHASNKVQKLGASSGTSLTGPM
jgi:Cu-Zn family superoxide dismutase